MCLQCFALMVGTIAMIAGMFHIQCWVRGIRHFGFGNDFGLTSMRRERKEFFDFILFVPRWIWRKIK